MKKLLLLAAACAFLFGCSGDDDGRNNNCSQPGSIVIEELNSASVLISWGIEEETAWEIEYGTLGFVFGEGTIARTSEREFFADDLTPETAYEIYVRTNCGSEGLSDRVSTQFTTAVAIPDCNAPSDLFLADVGADFIEFGWAENNETVWQVEFGLTGFELGTGTVVNTSESTTTLTGLEPSTTYEIYVRANCGQQGFSTFSDVFVITTNGN